MPNYLQKTEIQLSEDFIKNGYIIKKISDIESLKIIRDKIIDYSKIDPQILKQSSKKQMLNNIHKYISIDKLNSFRLEVIQKINSDIEFKKLFYNINKKYLDILVGNELAMQKRINLSIQFPNDSSSLLPVHADTWAGDSAFEIVVWLPLVDCFGTKSMFILPQNKSDNLKDNFKKLSGNNTEDLYQNIKHDVIWVNIKFGEVFIFNQALPHGNRVNNEKETRWSMNCRFKGVFTPYADKKLGEFFEPVTLRAASKIGMNYKLPKTL